MGAICSRRASEDRGLPDAKGMRELQQQQHNSSQVQQPAPCPSPSRTNGTITAAADTTVAPKVFVMVATHEIEDPEERKKTPELADAKPESGAVPKTDFSYMSEVIRGAGTVSLGKAVEALDTLGSTMTNLNPGRKFASGIGGVGGGAAVTHGNKIGILAFEVANTIVKGCNLKQSLERDEIKVLKDEILVSKGVQLLVSTDMEELMWIAAADKRDELKIFAGEVIRFGNHCRDPQWHQLDRVFDRLGLTIEDSRQSKEQADVIMQNLMTLAENTAELYHEMHALDRFQMDLKRKQHEEALIISDGGDSIMLLRSEVKSQEKHVKALKKRCLWSKVLEEVMDQLVDIVYYMYQEIHDNFGPSVLTKEGEEDYKRKTGKLGTSGLALHYANIINQIESVFLRSNSITGNIRDTLYQGLSPTMKASLRSRLQQSSKKDARTCAEIRGELSTFLEWLVPVASNTTKAHHGFGWVGEWANTGARIDLRGMGHVELTLLQTLHHADQEKVENYILELIVLLHYFVCWEQKNNGPRSQPKSPPSLPSSDQANIPTQGQQFAATSTQQQQFQQMLPPRSISPPPVFTTKTISPPPPPTTMTTTNTANGHQISNKNEETTASPKLGTQPPGENGLVKPRKALGLSKSQEFDTVKVAANRKLVGLSKSNSHSTSSTLSKIELSASLVQRRWNHSISSIELDVDRIKEFDRVLSAPPSSPTHS
ncbi:unnamed protein product [Sphagnum troendelagicum]|uniref:Uncharacterized protein n=1 Tax=Sphagnum troendelagicum TaxID=128251 RepID=A0ABP0UN04_9BRYO